MTTRAAPELRRLAFVWLELVPIGTLLADDTFLESSPLVQRVCCVRVSMRACVRVLVLTTFFCLLDGPATLSRSPSRLLSLCREVVCGQLRQVKHGSLL